jgi:DNA-binding NarL/FixJ family response regulator
VSEGPEVAPVRVLVADDDASIRRMMARLLSKRASIELVGMAADAEEAVELGARTRPDVALVDVNMPKGGGVPAARELHPQSARSGDQCCRKALHFNWLVEQSSRALAHRLSHEERPIQPPR